MTNASTTQAANYDPEQEVRFAIVLYGGVSLAIYINGVTQELLRMVRGTAHLPANEALSGTERIYRELGQLIGPGGEPGGPPNVDTSPIRTRFVVDVISGSSAGGINGIALAKALALKRRDLRPLRDVWLDKAQLDSLLNDSGSERDKYPSPKTNSLLNGERMYGMVLETLRMMNVREECTPAAGPFADKLDLFVTTTDLRGLSAPIQLAGQSIPERVHKVVFHFEYAPGPEGSETHAFDAKHDAMLAFAGRATSSFPVAFEPMRFERIEHQLRRQKTGMSLDEATRSYGTFFPAYVARGEPFHGREFADGGYLDNRPFSHAIDVIQYRSSTRPVLRKLLFVDPFSDVADKVSEETTKEISFLDNAILAGSTLPRYEVIREDIRRVTSANRRLDRLNALQKRNEKDKEELKFDAPSPAPPHFSKLDLREVVQLSGLGRSYPIYHHLRVYDTTDVLAKMVTRAAGFEIDSDEYAYLRILLRGWREDHYTTYHDGSKETENTFLSHFDADYRLRRLNHMRGSIDEVLEHASAADQDILKRLRASVEAQLASLRDTTRALASRTDNPLMNTQSAAFLRTLLGDHFTEVMGQIGMDAQYARAKDIYRRADIKPHVDEVMNQIGRRLAEVFEANRKQMDKDLPRQGSPEVLQLAETYRMFHTHDALALPFLEGSDAREHAEIQVYRVSPTDSASLKPTYMSNGSRKLAGPAFAAFGGFLQREWREHDMMWGRLDGAERIITALLPDPAHKVLRDSYIARAHDIILTEEFSGPNGENRVFSWLAQTLRAKNVTDRSADELIRRGTALLTQFPSLAQLIQAKDFRTFLVSYYSSPPQPVPEKMAGWTARSLRIISRMFDELPDGNLKRLENRAAGILRSAGVLLANLLHFAVPGSIGRKVAAHWLLIISLAGVLMIIVSLFVTAQGLALTGYATVLACFILWVVMRLFGAWVKGRRPFRDIAFAIFAIAVLGLAGLGAVHLWELLVGA